MTTSKPPPPPPLIDNNNNTIDTLLELTNTIDLNILNSIRSAINSLTTNSNHHHQATQYLHDLIITPPNGWNICLAVLANESLNLSQNPNVTFYTLQSIQLLLKNIKVNNHLFKIKSTIWSIVKQKLLFDQQLPNRQHLPLIPSYLTNKFALSVTILFATMWPELWPDFWPNVFELLPPLSHQNQSDPSLNRVVCFDSQLFNPSDYRPNIDFFLRLCLSIDHEIVNPLIHRDPIVVPKYQLIKDRMREEAIQQMVQYWYVIVQAYISDNDMVLLVLKNITVYISWIDVSLIVNDPWISLIMKLIHHQSHDIQISAIECLIEIVGKGMKSSDKLQLLSYLQLIPLLQSLTHQFFQTKNLNEDDEQLAFIAQLGKLVNVVGCQILYTWIDPSTNNSSNPDELRQVATQALHTLFPIYLTYYSDDWDHVHDTVMDMTTQLVSVWKSLKKSPASNVFSNVTSADSRLAQQLFQATITKMQYHPDQATPKAGIIISGDSGSVVDAATGLADQSTGADDEEDEDVLEFIEQRRSLKLVFDNLAHLIPDVCAQHCFQLITTTLNKVQENMSNVQWNEAELCLHVLYILGEAMKVVAKVKDEKSGSAYRNNFSSTTTNNIQQAVDQQDLTPLAQLLVHALKSGICSYPHLCIEPLFLEIMVRYSGFFVCCPQYLPQAFNYLVTGMKRTPSDSGIGGSYLRARATYLLLRFVKDIKSVIAPVIEVLIMSLADLLGPPPVPAANETGPKKISIDLYEIISILVSHESISVTQRVEYLKGALAPLMQALHSATTRARQVPKQASEFMILAQYAATIMNAAGALGICFTTSPVSTPKTQPRSVGDVSSEQAPSEMPWAPVFIEANQLVLVGLEVFVDQQIVREAARGCFQCTVKAMGSHGCMLLPPLMRVLLLNVDMCEVSEVLSFLGLLIHQHRAVLTVFLDELVQPVLSMVVKFLNRAPEGTDDAMTMKSIRRSYFSVLGSIVTMEYGLAKVLVSETNLHTVPTILATVVAGASECQDRGLQKIAFSLLGKMLCAWTKTPIPAQVPSTWVTETMYPVIAQVCIEMPLKRCDLANASTLGVMQDVASLHKTVIEVHQQQWPDYLIQVYLPAIGCPTAMANEYAGAVASMDAKLLAQYLRQFLVQNRAT